MDKKIVQKIAMPFLHLLWVGLIFIGVSIFIGDFVRAFASDFLVNWLATPFGSAVLSMIVYALIACVVILPYILLKLPRKSILRRLGMTKFEPLPMFVWALFAWGLSMVATTIVVFVLVALNVPGLQLDQKQEIGFENLSSIGEYVAAFFVLVVLAPLFEEIIFRGYLQKRLRETRGVVFSIVFSSLIFAVLHFQLNVIISVFVLSLFIGYLREKFDSIWPGVMVHALRNGLAYMLLFILPLYGLSLV